jgi:uncharacterized membrane protein YgcG
LIETIIMADPNARYLGGANPLQQRRTLEAAERHLSGVSKLDRSNLTQTDMSKLKRAAETGLETKFSMMEPFVGTKTSTEQLKSIYSVTMRMEEFRKSLQSFDMDDVFCIASDYEMDADTNWIPAVGNRPINLFTSHQDVDLETVKRASSYSLHWGADFVVQNLLWSGAKLLNSCDDTLRQKLEEKTIGWAVHYTTGPVYFKLLMQNILASTPESLRGLTSVLETTTLTDFDGENVTQYVSFARGAIEQLRNNEALPFNILSIVATALRHCETDDFVGYIQTMYNNHIQHVRRITVDELLTDAEAEFVSLTLSKKWSAKLINGQQSAFFTGNCYSCGAPGHRSNDKVCPNYKEGSPGRGRSGGGRGRGRGRGTYRGGRGSGGRGRGDGGRGGRGARGTGGAEKDRTPPKAQDPHTRTNNNRTEKWCGIHGYWTWGDIAHESSECPNKASAHIATTTTTNTPADPTPTPQPDSKAADSKPGFSGLAFHAADF